MLNKKQKDEPELTPDQQLEAKVDAMLDPRHQDPIEPIVEPTTSADSSNDPTTPPPLDIFAGTKTAPEVPENLKEQFVPVPAESAESTASHVTESEPAVSQLGPDTAENDQPNPNLEDSQTDKAVDDITRQEADQILAAEDQKTAQPVLAKKSDHKIRRFFAAWWRNRTARNSTIFIILIAIAGVMAWPSTRYAILNTAGVRSGASLKIVDQSTGLPLKKVTVQLGSQQVQSDEMGVAAFKGLELGPQRLVIDRVAFAPMNQTITLGWGSNPLGNYKLKAVGAQYIFTVTDYLSDKPVPNVEAVSGDAAAFADKTGKVTLTVEDPETETLTVSLRAEDYRTEKVTFSVNTKTPFAIRMVPAQPVVYVTKQSGNYDLYRVDTDGKNKRLLLAGTGNERQNLSVAVSPDGTQAALVSSRGPKRDSSGYLLDTLTLIDLKTGKSKMIDDAQNIKLVDWVKQRLIYQAAYGAPSAATGDRQRIVTYDTEESARNVLASADYFNGVMSAEGYVYFAVADSDPKEPTTFQKIRTDGSGKQVVLNKSVYNVQRISASKLSLETDDGWYEYGFGDTIAVKANPPAETRDNRQYIASPNGNKTVWVDNRDGKGVLLIQDKAGKDRVFETAGGLSLPVRWLSNSVVMYRVSNSDETAEYVKNLQGGPAKKVIDVTPASGFGSY